MIDRYRQFSCHGPIKRQIFSGMAGIGSAKDDYFNGCDKISFDNVL